VIRVNQEGVVEVWTPFQCFYCFKRFGSPERAMKHSRAEKRVHEAQVGHRLTTYDAIERSIRIDRIKEQIVRRIRNGAELQIIPHP